MVPNSQSLVRNSALSPPFLDFSRKLNSHFPHQTRILAIPVHITGFSVPSLSSFRGGSWLMESGHSKMGFGGLVRLSASSGNGSDGVGGFGGNGDGNSGGSSGGSDSGDTDNWSLLSWYLALLSKYPVLTKAVTSAVLTFIGDLICQLAIDKVQSPDMKRTAVFSLLGLVLVGPTLHFWYLYLSKLVIMPGASGAFLRLVLDQFIFAPIFLGVFLSSLVTLEGRPSQVVPKLQQEWFSAVLANWQLWIPFQFLNFRFVPQQLQVLASNVVALAWNVILSFKAHKEVVTK